MAEFGDPDKPEEWAFLRNHSPYQRLQDVCLQAGSGWVCPQILFTTSTKDDRVHPGHARKMVKALAEAPEHTDGKVYYWENIEGGHGGAADNKQRAHMWALSYNFLWQKIGHTKASL
jgi:prolyl oligopeptidase